MLPASKHQQHIQRDNPTSGCRVAPGELSIRPLSPAPLGFDEVFGGHLFRKHPMLFDSITKDRQTTAIAHRDGEPCVCERLPPVRVVDDVTDGSFAVDRRDPPIQSDSVAGPAFVFAEWV